MCSPACPPWPWPREPVPTPSEVVDGVGNRAGLPWAPKPARYSGIVTSHTVVDDIADISDNDDDEAGSPAAAVAPAALAHEGSAAPAALAPKGSDP